MKLTLTQSRQGTIDVLHQTAVEDPYRYLEDATGNATRRFVQKESRYYLRYLSQHRAMFDTIAPRVETFMLAHSSDLPLASFRDQPIFLKLLRGASRKSLVTLDSAGQTMVLIDVNEMSSDPTASLVIIKQSRCTRYLVVGLRLGGTDSIELHLYDLESHRLLPDTLRRGMYRGLAVSKAGDCFYYSIEDAEGEYRGRHAIRRHILGTNWSSDTEVWSLGARRNVRLILHESEDGSSLGYSIIELSTSPHTTFMLHRLPLTSPPRKVVEIANASFGPRFDCRHVEALTTVGAPNGRIVRFSVTAPSQAHWETLIPESDSRVTDFECCGALRVLHYQAGRNPKTAVFTAEGIHLTTILYPTSGATVLGHVDSRAGTLYYAHSDIAIPPAQYRVNLQSGVLSQWHSGKTVSTVATVMQVAEYASSDGTLVPITIVRPRKEQHDPIPMVLTCYGTGGTTSAPAFSPLLAVLLENGIGFAIAHVRGGGEKGVEWHSAGRGRRKVSSVDDYLCAAEWLMSSGQARPEKVASISQSSGTVIALPSVMAHPEMFCSVVALGPLTDLTRFHLFGAAAAFVKELGSPDDADDFKALYSLSPYHHIIPGRKYPAMLLVTGGKDERCDPLHARKFVARLRDVSPGSEILLDYDDRRGHKPALPLERRVHAVTARATFLLHTLGGRL